MTALIKKYPRFLLFSCAVLVYINTLFNGFVFDDAFFSQRKDLFSLSSLPKLFLQSYLPNNKTAGVYRPLTIASYALNFSIFGASPFSFHLVNILLHGCITLLMFSFAKSLKLPFFVSFLATILFAVHPIHVEAVAYIKARDELFHALFFLLTILLFFRTMQTERINLITFLGSICTYFFGLLSKEMAITIPVLCFLFFVYKKYYIHSRSRLLFLSYCIGWGVSLLGYGYLRHIALGEYFIGAYNTAFAGNMLYVAPFVTRIVTGLEILWIYVRTVLFPMHLSATYGYAQILPVSNIFSSYQVLLGILVSISFLGMGILGWRKKNYLLVYCMTAVVMVYLPISQIILPMGDIVAERWMYVPTLFISLYIAIIVKDIIAINKYAYVSIAIILISLASRTFVRNRVWASNQSIYESMVRSSPQSVQAHTALAQEYFYLDRLSDAKKHAEVAKKIYPEFPELYTVMGKIATREGKWEEAFQYYQKSLELFPNSTQVYALLGKLFFTQGNYLKAREYFSFVLHNTQQIRTEDIFPYAATLAKLQLYDQSLSALQTLTVTEQKTPEALFLFAVNYYKLGQTEEVLRTWNPTISREERKKILEEY